MNNFYNRHVSSNNYYRNSNTLSNNSNSLSLRDYGDEPFIANIEELTKRNNNFRLSLWTGEHFQITLMCINPGECIGLEVHPCTDQFLRIEQGVGFVQMGESKNNLNFQRKVFDNYAIVIPAGTWHNLTNIGNIPIKLYSIYAPPNHPKGTVEPTKPKENN